MIQTKKDLLEYLEQDIIALKRGNSSFKKSLKNIFFPDYIFRFQKALRYSEYYYNSRKGLVNYILFFFYFSKYKRLGLKLGFSIPLNVFGPGLAIVHIGTIVVNSATRVGSNCRIHVCTNIGTSSGGSDAPIIGDNVYIAPGVKIYGNITICNNVALAANAAVSKSIIEENTLHGGIPAKKISDIDIKKLIKHL